MKYVLMIIMFLCTLGVCIIINKVKEERILLLKEIKQSTKAYNISQYFMSLDVAGNKQLSMLRGYVDDVASKRSKVKETKETILEKMDKSFAEKNDSTMLLRWLSLIKNPKDSAKRDDVEKQCNMLIERCKGEEKSNIYIALTLSVVMVILLI